MNTDVEDLLREGMERLTADLRARAGLTRRVVRRRRRRRLAMRSAAGAAAALAAGIVALAVVVLPGDRYDSSDAAAYVVKRVDSALSAADPGQLAQMTVTTRGLGPSGTTVASTAQEWSYGGQWRAVTYSRDGQPLYDEGVSAASVYTLVSYQAREWARQPGLGRPAGQGQAAAGQFGCAPQDSGSELLFVPGLPGIDFSVSSPPTTLAKALRTAVSCGTLTVAGRQRVNGIEAIELTSSPGSAVSETIWVDPGSYLPVRVVISPAPGQPAPLQGAVPLQQTADITWLPPTAQNLAKLTVSIPAGFRHVALGQALLPIVRETPNTQVPRGVSAPFTERSTRCPSRVVIRPAEKGPAIPGPARSMLASPRLTVSCPASGR
jgi:hypothetical protein